MAVVIFHRLAHREYEAACRRYGQRSQQTRARFEGEVARAVQHIADDPFQWPVYRNDIRWVRTRRYPYVLYFRILDAQRVLLLALAHGSRRPGYWLRRTQP